MAEVAEWPQVLIGVTPNCIVFTRWVGFLIIRPMKKELDLKFYSKQAHPEKPVIKSIASGEKFENHIRVATLDNLRPAQFLYLRESYEVLK